MKRSAIQIVIIVCLIGVLAGLLLLIPKESPRQEPTLQTQTVTEKTEPSETALPTEETRPVLQNNPFAPGDFVREGEWMTCTAPYRLGVDVSAFQGTVDWQKVARSGVEFAIIRVGGRGYGQTGVLYADDMAQANYASAKAAGLQVGAYFFSQAICVEEAVAEAHYVLELTKDWELDLPVVFDWEYVSDTARTATTDGATVTACADAFCKEILVSGRQAMLYVRPEDGRLDLQALAEYPHWVALYSDTMDYPYSFAMWQYTNRGRVPGIDGNVDINIWVP